MKYYIKIESPEHSRKVQEHLFSLGYEWVNNQTVQHTDAPYLSYETVKKVIYFCSITNPRNYENCTFAKLMEKTCYELVEEREVIKIGDNSYYKDELETALKNINPISQSKNGN